MSPFIVLKGRERFAVDYNEQKERGKKNNTEETQGNDPTTTTTKKTIK